MTLYENYKTICLYKNTVLYKHTFKGKVLSIKSKMSQKQEDSINTKK